MTAPTHERGIIESIMLTAQQVYSEQVRHMPLAERLRLAALLLDELQSASATLPTLATESTPRPRPKRGSGKHDISYMADDFDAPLEEMREYSE